MDTAIDAAFSDPHLPQYLAFLIRVDSMDDAGFLPGNQRPPPIRKRYENGRRSEVEIGTIRIGAVALVG